MSDSDVVQYMAQLETHTLEYHYSGGTPLHFPDLHVTHEMPLAILGPSGCGKTTLLHLMAGLRKPVQGSIALNGEALEKMNERSLDHFRGVNIGLVFQQGHFVAALTVRENLLAAPFCAGKKASPERGRQLAERLGFDHKLNAYPRDLSQGEQQRVAIARAVMNQPALLLADEPTSSLDDARAELVLDLLIEEARQNEAALVVVTHDKRVQERIPQNINL